MGCALFFVFMVPFLRSWRRLRPKEKEESSGEKVKEHKFRVVLVSEDCSEFSKEDDASALRLLWWGQEPEVPLMGGAPPVRLQDLLGKQPSAHEVRDVLAKYNEEEDCWLIEDDGEDEDGKPVHFASFG